MIKHWKEDGNYPQIKWKDNTVVSVDLWHPLRPVHKYTLVQMITRTWVVFFNIFSDENVWDDIDLENVEELFCVSITTKQFFKLSGVSKPKIKSKENLDSIHDKWLSNIHQDSEYHTIWKGTPNEMKVLDLGARNGMQLVKNDIFNPTIYTENVEIVKNSVTSSDVEIIDKYELEDMRGYAELNERLYLCSLFNKNIDPLKDFIFHKDLPLEYKTYFDILMYVN